MTPARGDDARPCPRDRGAGSVLLTAVVAVVLSAATATLGLAGALVARQRAEAAADLVPLSRELDRMLALLRARRGASGHDQLDELTARRREKAMRPL